MIKFAIIGCGRIAQRHAQNITHYGQLTAVCDVVVQRADEMADKFGAQRFYNVEDLISAQPDVDVIAICTPNGLHAFHSILALEAGYHVICEKPMAISTEDCRKMIQAAELSGKYLFAVKQNRYNPPVAAVKKLLDEQKLGKLFSIHVNGFWNRGNDYYLNSWHGTADLDGGTLFTQFSHFIDVMYWLNGDVKSMSGFLKNCNHPAVMDFEDTGSISFQFKNGSIGSLQYSVNSFGKNMEGSITIFAEYGTIKIGGEYLNELEYQMLDNFTIADLPKGNPANQYGAYSGSMSNHHLVYENVIDVLLNGVKATTSAYDALKTVEIIERIYQSAKKL